MPKGSAERRSVPTLAVLMMKVLIAKDGFAGRGDIDSADWIKLPPAMTTASSSGHLLKTVARRIADSSNTWLDDAKAVGARPANNSASTCRVVFILKAPVVDFGLAAEDAAFLLTSF